MTENKRFALTFDDKIVDNLTGIIHEVHSGYDVAMDLSGLLNELADENEQLKQIMGFLKNDNANDIVDVLNLQQNKIVKLVEENEYLKIRFKEERDTAMRLGSECDNLTIKKQELELEILRLEMIIKTGGNGDVE